MAAVTPIVLSACYGAPPCEPDEQVDADGDGFFVSIGFCDAGIEDCDDADSAINPDAEEICDNEVDENCDGIVAGAGTTEVCGNELDDDCDGQVDEEECGTPTDTGTSGAPGSLRIELSWTAGVTTCAEAGVAELEVTVDPDGAAEPHVSVVPCDDRPIRYDDLQPGAFEIRVRGQASDGLRNWTAGRVPTEVLSDQTVPVGVVLTCSSDTPGACGS